MCPFSKIAKKLKSLHPTLQQSALYSQYYSTVAQNCNPEIGRHGHRDAHGLSGTDPRLKLRISIRTMPKDVDTL